MRRFQWKSRQTVGLTVLAVVIFLLLRIRKYSYHDSVTISKIRPTVVWEFVADFSNMKLLNPTIVDFSILSESGNYDHWKYAAQYSENLSHWPYLFNTAYALFDIKGDKKKGVYLINSIHETCLFAGHFCLKSESEFKFSKSPTTDGALCEETIEYQCPAVLQSFCRREVVFQRTAIMKNLEDHFSQLKDKKL